MKKFPIYFVLLILAVFACVNPIKDFVQVDAQSFLDIEADLNDQPGGSVVKLNMSSKSLQSGVMAPVAKAGVSVTDDQGVKVLFLETTSGNYTCPKDFKGVAGRSYQLNIQTKEGKVYQSSFEKMQDVPDIQQVVSQFEIKDNFGKQDQRRAGFNILVDFQDSPNEVNYYQWNWKHYEKITYCAFCDGGNYDFVKNQCNYNPPSGHLYRYVCDGNCWDISFNDDISIFSDTYVNGQRVVGKQVARAPYDDKTPYYFELEQRSITKTAYTFFLSLANVIQNSGTFFDIPAETRFSLNIKSTSNPDEKILGVFNVYSVKKRIFYIDRTKGVPSNEFPLYKIIPGETFTCDFPCKSTVSCFEGPTRTKIAPVGWVQ